MSGRLHLTEAQRAVLARIMARPGLSDAQVAAIFEAKTGRKINRSSVERRRRRGPHGATPGNRHLPEAGRAVLHHLILEGSGEASYQEIARQFEAVTGRTLAPQVAWWHARRVLGLPGVGKGHGPQLKVRAADRRLAAASARKLDAAKVDRSPRIRGRSVSA